MGCRLKRLLLTTHHEWGHKVWCKEGVRPAMMFSILAKKLLKTEGWWDEQEWDCNPGTLRLRCNRESRCFEIS